jgi:RNA polymerase sigma factor (sigma-70 family)
MRPRQQLTELFSTFLQFEADQATRWATDPRLRRQMQQRLDQNAEATSEKFWVLYWYRLWQQIEPQARPVQPELHLTAYLQEPGYWAAYQMIRRFTDLQYRLPDCFQMAIAEVAAVLKGYNPERGASLKTYAGMAFTSALRDALRQRQVVDLCTDWALLRRISRKRLLEALHQAGLSDRAVVTYQVAWNCFRAQYVPASPTERLPQPDTAFWEAVLRVYRHEQPDPAESALNAATLEQRLTQMAHWVRGYLYPAVRSLNMPQFGDASTEQQDSLPGSDDSLLTKLVQQEEADERRQQQTQLTQTLNQALMQLDAQSQTILRLYYEEGLTQQQIMKEMEMSQASVSRRLSKAREALLTTLVQWSQSLNISPTPSLIKDMSVALDEWLTARYQSTVMTPTP